MAARPCIFGVLGLVLAFGTPLFAADDEQAITDRIDAILESAWTEAGVSPALDASDAEFLRRASLDITGRIPTVADVREYLQNDDIQKRAKLIDRLLKKPTHARHLAVIWRDVMLPRNNNVRRFGQTGVFENWLFQHFQDNTPYNEMVRELLTATGQVNQTGPVLYYSALQSKPEDLAASTSRIFLGVQIECAQCHDHPFDKWKQEDFWGYAAFFAQLSKPQQRQQFVTSVADADSGEVKLPGTGEVVLPIYLGGKAASTESGTTRRQMLADWLTSPENPYFARATVNRAWSLLFGYGLVDPVDNFGDHNPPSRPAILDELAEDFASHGFNLHRLLRILANTRAYQLSSELVTAEAPAPELFSRMVSKSLTAEQIYNCLALATYQKDNDGNTAGRNTAAFNLNSRRQLFLSKFEAPTQTPTEFQAGIPQALTMMNGAFISQVTNLEQSNLLAAIVDSPFLTTAEERVQVLFLATLSRFPTEKEQARFGKFVESGGSMKDSKKALSDVLWALVNSTEFILNH